MKNKLLCTLSAALFTTIFLNPAYAIDFSSKAEYISPPNISYIDHSYTESVPYADTIVYKFRIHNGVKQYRRWNETKGCWVDPYWIDYPA